MAAKKVLKLIVRAKRGGTRTKYFKTQKSYNRWLKEGKGDRPGTPKGLRGLGETPGVQKKLIDIKALSSAERKEVKGLFKLAKDAKKKLSAAEKKLGHQNFKDQQKLSATLMTISKKTKSKKVKKAFAQMLHENWMSNAAKDIVKSIK